MHLKVLLGLGVFGIIIALYHVDISRNCPGGGCGQPGHFLFGLRFRIELSPDSVVIVAVRMVTPILSDVNPWTLEE